MILQTFSWDDGTEGLRIDHRDGSATLLIERPDGSTALWAPDAETFARLERALHAERLRPARQRAGRASAEAKRRRRGAK